MIGEKRYTDLTTLDETLVGEQQDLDEDDAVLMEVAPKPRVKIVYEYDFGDSWMHLIEKTYWSRNVLMDG